MKHTLLLFIIGIITQHAVAQHSGRIPGDREISVSAMRQEMNKRYYASGEHKTTGPGGSRWYSYCDAIDTFLNFTLGPGPHTALYTQTIWKDTNGTINYPAGLAHNTFVSQASIFDPRAAMFNCNVARAYNGEIMISSTDAFVLDSVDIFAVYEYNRTKTAVIDTLRMMFTRGNGAAKSTTNVFGGNTIGGGGHYSSAHFLDMIYDSVANKGSGTQVADLYYRDIYLYNSGPKPAWGDTLPNGVWMRRIAVNGTGIACAAGDFVGWSVSFVSGDPETKGSGKLTSPSPGDTLLSNFNPGENEYNVWRPLVKYYAIWTGSPAIPVAQYPPYLGTASPVADQNAGYWKTLPDYKGGWGGIYQPLWHWNNGASAVELQFPYISWHITCPMCDILSSSICSLGSLEKDGNADNRITVAPNPAINELNITFSMQQLTDVSVSITNMLGQVVASQIIKDAASGTAAFNTSMLPAGAYIYIIEGGGERATGRVVIAH